MGVATLYRINCCEKWCKLARKKVQIVKQNGIDCKVIYAILFLFVTDLLWPSHRSWTKITYPLLGHRAAISPFMMAGRGVMDALLFVGCLWNRVGEGA